MVTIIDISQPLFECRLFPGDAPPTRKRVREVAKDGYNLTEIAMNVHNGTHVDAPQHFVKGGAGVGDLPLDIFYGRCVVKAWDGAIPAGCERLLLKGGYQLTVEDAELIAQSGVRLVGVESQSVGAVDAPAPVHRVLLGAGVVALEGLALGGAEAGTYTLAAFPLNLGDCDGSPVRAALISTGAGV